MDLFFRSTLNKALEMVFSSLESGPFGPLSLMATTFSVLLPLSLYNMAYSFTVGYGMSVFVAATVIFFRLSLSQEMTSIGSLLALATVFYGLRLAFYMVIRVRLMPRSMTEGPIWKKILLATACTPFNALLTTSLLVASRTTVGVSVSPIGAIGVALAWFGAALEAAADWQKHCTKQRNPGSEGTFVGPTSGVYLLCRHPNYLGEVLFWTGSLLAAVPSMGESRSLWICSILGWMCIFGEMLRVTSHLEVKQSKMYSGQPLYDEWKSRVTSSLFPCFAS